MMLTTIYFLLESLAGKYIFTHQQMGSLAGIAGIGIVALIASFDIKS